LSVIGRHSLGGGAVEAPEESGTGKEEAMAKGDIHTVRHGDRWVNEVEDGKRASNSAPTKAEALAKGREMAIDRGVEHVIHKQNGQIGERHTYPRNRDPRRSKG
jgi:Uncharacterized protein conserved in bacteria (DUF2188)